MNGLLQSQLLKKRLQNRRSLTWQQEHLSFSDRDLPKLASLDTDGVQAFLRLDPLASFDIVDDFQCHVSLVLIEPFFRFVDVIV